ncbi:MAG: ABC transporter permease [Deltaproteobacteria bacterium]|nr:ABC transporter permease [Deltaproteobacteria bacterium]
MRSGWLRIVCIGLRRVWAHRLRSLAASLGILVGVAALAGLVSVHHGAAREASRIAERLGRPGFEVRSLPPAVPVDPAGGMSADRSGLTIRDARALEDVLPEAQAVGGMREVVVRETAPRVETPGSLFVVGAEPQWVDVTRLVVVEGRRLDARDEARAAAVCILGEDLRRRLFANAPAVGARIRLEQSWFTVVGVVQTFGERTGVARAPDPAARVPDVIVPLRTALSRLVLPGFEPELTEIRVAVPSTGVLEAHVKVGRRVLERLHAGAHDFEVLVPLQRLAAPRARRRAAERTLAAIAGLGFLLGGMNLVWALTVDVLERRSEIEGRLAGGESAAEVRRSFRVEAAAIAAFGGALGIPAGYAVAEWLTRTGGLQASLGVDAVVLGLVAAPLAGWLAGWFPTRRVPDPPDA